MVLTKHDLPYACKLSHIKFDIHKLREALIPFTEKFTDVYSANRGLCFHHESLADSVKDHFFQVSLTTCSSFLGRDSSAYDKNKGGGEQNSKAPFGNF